MSINNFMRKFINIVESRDSHYEPIEPLYKDKKHGSDRKYRLKKTNEILLVSVHFDKKDEDGDMLFTVTPYILTQEGKLKAIGNGHVVAYDAEAYFSNIAVVPEYRRMGVATAMYDQIEDMGYTVIPSPGDIFPDAENMWDYRMNRN